MTKNGAFRISGLIIALVLCVHLNVSAQTAAFTKTVKEFYRFYLTEEKKDPQKLKKFLSAELYQNIQKLEAWQMDEYFTRKSRWMSLSDLTKLEFSANSVHLSTKNAYYSRIKVSLKKENGKLKIDKVTGQTVREMEEELIEGKIETPELKNNLVKLEKPLYPPAAKAVRAFGEVKIEIVVDENGSVKSAKMISGHPLLREATEQAALKSTFSPLMVDGKPVKAIGIISFTFQPW